MKPRCRQCSSAKVASHGRIPDYAWFSGQPLDPPWDGGHLYECQACGLGFRHPARSDEAFERLYASLPDNVWVNQALRPDQARVKALIEARPGVRSVLDVGCYVGTLLAALDSVPEKYGVEASSAAAAVARRQNVRIVASNISELRSIEQRFDVVCAVDVIEHVNNPSAFLEALTRLLAPDGLLVISTGSIDAPAWRLAGGRYWYCSFTEHISFVSPRWAKRWADGHAMVLSEVQRFAYETLPTAALWKARARFVGQVLRSRVKWRLLSLLPGRLRRAKPGRIFGGIGIFDDHIILAFTRRAEGGRAALPATAAAVTPSPGA